jgi:hypothetical protein
MQEPHGGTLVDLFAAEAEIEALVASCDQTIELNDRQSCDTQLLCNGGFSPLTGFMTEDEYTSVVENMRLPSDVIMGATMPSHSCKSQMDVVSLLVGVSADYVLFAQAFLLSWIPLTHLSRLARRCF